jgi:hypothetical protein
VLVVRINLPANTMNAAPALRELAGHWLLVADPADIIGSKRAAGRPRDKAVLEILEKTLH